MFTQCKIMLCVRLSENKRIKKGPALKLGVCVHCCKKYVLSTSCVPGTALSPGVHRK